MIRYRPPMAAGILILLLTACGLSASGPTVGILGISTGVQAFDNGEDAAGLEPLLALSGSFSTREALAGGGYFNLLSSAAWLIDDRLDTVDQESLQLKLALPAGAQRLELEAGWNSSLSGSPAYLRPQWRLGYNRRSRTSATQLELSSAGSWTYQPRDQEDVLQQEIRAGLVLKPSLRLRWELSAAAGYEYHGETPLVNELGVQRDARRRDLLFDIETAAGGLWGYFADWRLSLGVVYRRSNANRFLATLFDPDSESRFTLAAGGDLNWSPRHNISVQIGSFASPSFYLFREARRQDNSFSGEKLATLTYGGSLRADWTRNHRLYLVISGDAGHTRSNDPAEEQWYFSAGGGLEYSY